MSDLDFDQLIMQQDARNIAPLTTNIYLGGAVSELLFESPSYAAQWRDEFPSILKTLAEEDMDFKCFNPCEGQYDENGNFRETEYNSFRFTQGYILDNCVHQVLMSGILIMNFLNCEKYYSPGSFWEMGFAFAMKNKYIILIDDKGGKAAHHPILRASSNFIASSLYEAAQYCVHLNKKHYEIANL